MTANFPSGYSLERSSSFEYKTNTTTDILDNGNVMQRTLNDVVNITVGAEFRYLDTTEKNTLIDFLDTNKGDVIVWTIDGITLIGYIKGSYRLSMSGNRFNVRFTYEAVKYPT